MSTICVNSMFGFAKRFAERSFRRVADSLPDQIARHALFLLRHSPDLTDRWGYHIRPMHYYEPLPNWQLINRQQLERCRFSPAIDFGFEEQCALIGRLARAVGEELAQLGRQRWPTGFDFMNSYFAGLDAAVYYALIRDLKPSLVIEIGSGFSTQIASKALARNRAEGQFGRLLCVEPYPQPRLTESGADFELIKKPVQSLDLKFFEQLGSNDILMIDSSHVATVGSDVCFEFLEILPILKPNVWVHIHDIFYPTDYPPDWVIGRRQAFNEQYVVEAFLAFNRAYSVRLANSWLWHSERETASELFRREYLASPPASLWISRVL